MRKGLFLLSLFLVGCTSQSKEEKKPSFKEIHFLFDMESEVDRFSCPIVGTIPSWLSGNLFRNGPAKFRVGNERVAWFDGLAMLHLFSITSDEVLYTNKFLRSDQYHHMMVDQDLKFSGFDRKVKEKETEGTIKNADVNIAEYAKKMVALTETPLPVTFDSQTLKTLGVFNYEDSLPKMKTWESAHPLSDPRNKESINYLVEFGKESYYVLWKMKEGSETREKLAAIPVKNPSYMHTFSLTENFIILTQYPLVVSPLDLLIGNKAFIRNFKWKPELGTLFTFIERSSGKVIKEIKTFPFFSYHHVNAFEKEGAVILDSVVYKNANDIIEDEPGEEDRKTQLYRFTLNGDTLTNEILFDKTLEMPRVPTDLISKEYRYCYAADYRFPKNNEEIRSLYKVDTETKKALSWEETGCFPGEPVFVPHPEAKEEDEGVVLSLILDFINNHSFLLILDAKDFKEVARVKVPSPIPAGLHGVWK